jgi:hypothetical protein
MSPPPLKLRRPSHFLRPLLEQHQVAQALVNERSSLVAEAIETAFDSPTRRRGLLGRAHRADGRALVLARPGHSSGPHQTTPD